MFIPKHLQQWRPPSATKRHCHWCASGPWRLRELGVHMEGPMRWYFCTEVCCDEWQDRRFDADVREWLQHPAGVRAKVLVNSLDAPTNKAETRAHRSLANVCSVSRVALSMRKGT